MYAAEEKVRPDRGIAGWLATARALVMSGAEAKRTPRTPHNTLRVNGFVHPGIWIVALCIASATLWFVSNGGAR